MMNPRAIEAGRDAIGADKDEGDTQSASTPRNAVSLGAGSRQACSARRATRYARRAGQGNGLAATHDARRADTTSHAPVPDRTISRCGIGVDDRVARRLLHIGRVLWLAVLHERSRRLRSNLRSSVRWPIDQLRRPGGRFLRPTRLWRSQKICSPAQLLLTNRRRRWVTCSQTPRSCSDRGHPRRGAPPRQVKVDTVIVREHRGVMHEVLVVPGGFC
jgi:hypothetical protein